MKKQNSEYIAIATVFSNLIKKYYTVNTQDEFLIIEALRRSNNSLKNENLTNLGDYLSNMNAEQLKGLENNIKGIYHELKYVEYFNSEDNGYYAEVYEDTNHAGADVVLKDSVSHNIVNEIQLKATDSSSYVEEHIKRYQDINILTTSEIADGMDGIESSGISNETITKAVNEQFEQVNDLATQAQIGDAVVTSGLLSAALRASEVISGKKELGKAGKDALVDIGIATSTTALVALLF